jgi:hypothetical protein
MMLEAIKVEERTLSVTEARAELERVAHEERKKKMQRKMTRVLATPGWTLHCPHVCFLI